MVANRETLLHGQQNVPVVALAAILGLPADGDETAGRRPLMLLGSGTELAAIRVDEVLGEDDLLVKGLGPQLVRVRNISGATVLGNGTVVPILNAQDLLKSALGRHGHQQVSSVTDTTSARRRSTRSILVVDDSITSRTLLKNVLESYGYEVATAVDGSDALTLLQERNFDLVSSDVEMPRMDGFELTARIRADERFSRLPVILVTSMDSTEDRKKGITVGADAYIVKSSFDQSDLLDTIRKLIQVSGAAP
jgi:two-component system chemotaxis sensor kinase CheA